MKIREGSHVCLKSTLRSPPIKMSCVGENLLCISASWSVQSINESSEFQPAVGRYALTMSIGFEKLSENSTHCRRSPPPGMTVMRLSISLFHRNATPPYPLGSCIG